MKIVTTDELSKTLRISAATARDLAKRGIIPAIRVGHGLRFDLEKVLNRLKAQPKKSIDRRTSPVAGQVPAPTSSRRQETNLSQPR